MYRPWRDLGYLAGALIAGLVSDRLGALPAIAVVAALTAAAGLRLHVALRTVAQVATPVPVREDDALRRS
ncbi:MAG: hypothetical protein WD794_07900 [Mycobacteriales bacterium]